MKNREVKSQTDAMHTARTFEKMAGNMVEHGRTKGNDSSAWETSELNLL